jgi:beta-glucosidase
MTAERTFPAGFLWGAATSAHQVEGDNTNSNWWAWEQEGGHIRNGDVSGIACDHWRRFDDDFALAAELGHTAQRISVEWARIEPEEGRFDEGALDHYRAVCDAIHRQGMRATVTLHHFTHPLWVARAGGWETARIVDWLARYAERTGRALGDRVDVWWTINEPMVAPIVAYLMGLHPPEVRDLGRALQVARHTLLAHGAMYRALKPVVPPGVPVGLVHNMIWFEPFDPSDAAHRAAAESQDRFANEWYLRGLTTGRVEPPAGQGEEIPGLRDSFDVLGLNYYSRLLVRPTGQPGALAHMALRRPGERAEFVDEMGWEVYPPGLRNHLVRLAQLGKPLYVTENGHATGDEDARCRYLLTHLGEVHAAIAAGADVRGYFWWSLMDNFEWAEGWSRHFGLIGLEPGTLARRPRPAAYLYRDVIRRNALPADAAGAR